MPQIAPIVAVDSNSSPTTFAVMQPAGGSLPAVFLATAKGPSVVAQPKLIVSSQGTSKARETKVTLRTPMWVTGTDGAVKVVDSVFSEIRTVVPDTCTDEIRADHLSYLSAILADAVMKEAMRMGYAPN